MRKLPRRLAFAVSLFALALGARGATPAIAASPEAANPLGVGATAPGAMLTAIDGTKFDLAKAFAEKPTVLVFYRGSWCPFCNRQLAALGELEPKLLALGYQIIAVSPDTADGLKTMAGKNKLPYRLLSDRAMIASSAYGVAFRMPDATEKFYRSKGVDLAPIPGGEGAWLPVPTVYLIGRDGVIKFAFSNPDYKVRLSTEALLAAAQATAK
jgi:peroxiredoxin